MCSFHLELVCLGHSILLCNIAFFILFQNFPQLLKKKKKIKYTPKRGREKYFIFVDNTMSHPWKKHILLFVSQDLGFNMTLGSCSRYIELCPPPFGYPSTHLESSHCLLHHELASMPCSLSLIFCRAFVQEKSY
jgi:hypothetical protein